MVALGLMIGFLALVPAPAGAADGDKVTFTVGLKNEVDSFNPFLGIEAPSYEMWALTYDFMVGYSMDDMSPVPALAKSWKTSEDGLTWTFDIREGVKWSDGQPFTAADIAYTYNRIIDGGPEATTWESYLSQVKTVTAPDDKTVVLTLSKPNAVLPLLPIPIIPEHVWKNVSEKAVKTYRAEPTADQPVVGTGPFRLVEGKAGGSTYRFEKNPDYWGGEPHVDEVVFRVFKAEDPMVQALIKGEVDFIHDISPIQVKALKGRDGITAINGQSPYFDEIAFNTGAVDTETNKPIGDGNPALKDPKFRHALGYAIDMDRLMKSAYQDAAKPGDVIVPPSYSQFRYEVPEDEAFKFDLGPGRAAARRGGLQEGRRRLPHDARRKADRDPAAVRPTGGEAVDHAMDFFSEWLKDIGIKSEVTAMESNKLTNTILDGEYDLFHWGWYMDPDPDSILDVFTCAQRGGWSDSWYCNPKYDALMKQQKSEVDDDKRIDEIKQMQQLLFEDSPYLVLAYTTDGQAYRSDRFACFVPQPKPDGNLLVQYGGYNYHMLRPVKDAGDCDGVAARDRGQRVVLLVVRLGGRRRQHDADRRRCRAGGAPRWRRVPGVPAPCLGGRARVILA